MPFLGPPPNPPENSVRAAFWGFLGSQKMLKWGVFFGTFFRTRFFLKKMWKMGGGLHIPPFVPAPSQTLPLFPTWRGKANRKVPRICPFTFHATEQLRNPRVLFFNFEIDSISETLTNAKTRHDFFLALGLFVVNVECLSGLALGLSGLGSSLVLPCLVYLFCCCCFLRRRRTVICLAGKLN